MPELSTRDTEIALEELISKLAQKGGPLHGLVNDGNRQNIINAVLDEFSNNGTVLTNENLKDPKMLTLICTTLVQAAVTEKFNPTPIPNPNKSLSQRYNELTPEQQKSFKDLLVERLQNMLEKAVPSLSIKESKKLAEELFMVLITDSAGNALGSENRYATAKQAFDTISSILSRNPVENTFSPYLEELLLTIGRLTLHKPIVNMDLKPGPGY